MLYGAGISMHGFAKEAGSFMDFEEAKSSALAKHEEIEAAEANYIRSLNLPTSSENLNIEFRLLRNVFGLLNPELIARLKRVIDDPTPDNWDAACGIILRSRSRVDARTGTIMHGLSFTARMMHGAWIYPLGL